MRTSRGSLATILILAGALLFWLGRWSYSRDVIVYSNQGYQVAVHLDWPTSGLPLAEYASVLKELRTGLTNEAMGHLESMLDSAVAGAMSRHPNLPSASAVKLDQALSCAARYREQFPRPLSQGSGFYWTSDKQLEVDRYLEGFRTQSRTN
jgi:hypothetical protein